MLCLDPGECDLPVVPSLCRLVFPGLWIQPRAVPVMLEAPALLLMFLCNSECFRFPGRSDRHYLAQILVVRSISSVVPPRYHLLLRALSCSAFASVVLSSPLFLRAFPRWFLLPLLVVASLLSFILSFMAGRYFLPKELRLTHALLHVPSVSVQSQRPFDTITSLRHGESRSILAL